MREIKIHTEYINMMQFLKFVGEITTGGEINSLYENNEVFLNDELVFEKRKKIYNGDVVRINNNIYIVKVS